MYALIYQINKVSLIEVLDKEDVMSRYKDYLEIHIFDAKHEILLKNNKEYNLEDVEKDNNDLHYDEEMYISTMFNSMNKSNYTSIAVRNYLAYNSDGILYVEKSRLVGVK